MMRQIALGLALALATVSSSVDAQVGGFIRKKAGEVVGGKKPAPAPTTTPAPATTTAKPESADPAPATPAAAPTAVAAPAAGKAAAKPAASPLETSELPVRQSANQVLRDGDNLRSSGDWNQLPFIPPAAVAAAYALTESAQVTLVETVAGALKTLVMSPAFLNEHNEYIKREHQAADHGLKGVIGMEEALEKNDLKALEAIQARETVALTADMAMTMPAEVLKSEFTRELAGWKANAANPKRRDQAKYQKMVAVAQPIESLPGGDEKFRRGYAVVKSIDNGGPDTEAAVFAMQERVRQEREQLAYDRHNLNAQLKQQLSTFVTVAAKVNFKAPTVEKGGKTVFVNAADERQGALWKACFRAGEAPTAAALKLARAWLAEL